jgi:quercetin dioxygenase-like cupin family protein
MLTYVQWERGGGAPLHSHVEEQLLLVVEGEVEMTVGEEARRLLPGDVVVIPPWTPHSGVGIAERSIAVEAFAPLRTPLLDTAPPPPQKT